MTKREQQILNVHSETCEPIFTPEYTGSAARSAAGLLAENWKQARLENPDKPLSEYVASDMDDTLDDLITWARMLVPDYQPAIAKKGATDT